MSSASYELLPPLQELTPYNHGPLVVVCSLLVVIIASLTVLTRLLTRYNVTRKFVVDDYLIVMAIIVSIAQTTCLIIACNYGLGRHRDKIDSTMFSVYSKALYAADILLIATLTLTKLSVVYLIIGLSPLPTITHLCHGALVVITIWGIAGIIATSFRCDLPQPWENNGHCIDLFGLSIFNCVMNIATDLALIVIPAYLIMNVQVANSKKLLVISLFGSRIIVIPFAIISIIKRQEAFTGPSSKDFTWQLVPSSIWLQSMVALSIMTACLPSIRRFFADLRTGLMGVHISEPLELTMKNSVSSEVDSKRKSKNLNKRVSGMFRNHQGSLKDQEEQSSWSRRQSSPKEQFTRGRSALSKTTVSHGVADRPPTNNVIVQTIDYQVEYQDNKNLGSSKRVSRISPANSIGASTRTGDDDDVREIRHILDIGRAC